MKNEGERRNKWSVGIIGQNEDFVETECSDGSQAARAVKPR